VIEDLADQECERHGVDRHMFIHEAGHVVAALRLGVLFKAVLVHGADGPTIGDLMVAGAEIEMPSDDPTTWVRESTQRAFDFLMAGACSETGLLQHAVPNGFDGDMAVWFRGTGMPRPTTIAHVEELAGGDVQERLLDLEAAAQAEEAAIVKLADHVASLQVPARMPYDQVVAFFA
jgi:hypothetical protein